MYCEGESGFIHIKNCPNYTGSCENYLIVMCCFSISC